MADKPTTTKPASTKAADAQPTPPVATGEGAPKASTSPDLVTEGARITTSSPVPGGVALDDPAIRDMFAADAGVGVDFGKQDLATPFLRVLQALSPQVIEGKPAFMEDARPGMLYNTITKQLFSGRDGVFIIPIQFQNDVVEFRIREDNGGGFVKIHPSNAIIAQQCKQDDKGRNRLPGAGGPGTGNEIIEFMTYFCHMMDPQTDLVTPVVLSLARTQRKKGREWNSLMLARRETDPRFGIPSSSTPSLFHYVYKLTTTIESNAQGSWYSTKFEPLCRTVELKDGMNIYKAARTFRGQITRGEAKVAYDAEEVVVEVGGAVSGDDSAIS